ncbi:MAG: RNA methyltransferase [Chloroflexi bacterium]|nr:RNA methyltransferase [Chloroflexota bacterium]
MKLFVKQCKNRVSELGFLETAVTFAPLLSYSSISTIRFVNNFVMRVSIISTQNSQIKHVVKLRNRRYRDANQLTVVEGIREIKQLLTKKLVPVSAFICPEFVVTEQTREIVFQLEQLATSKETRLFEIQPELFNKIAYRSDCGGVLVVVPYWDCHLDHLPFSQLPFFAVVENAEKPGNLGAILRSADAAGVNGVIVCTSNLAKGTDVFNPNVIRASLGAIFSVPMAIATTEQAIDWLKGNGIQLVAATPDALDLYTAVELKQPTAIITGSEAYGLSNEWIDAADQKVAIPMVGVIDSLNLSVSTALLLYEVVRQRKQN